MEQLFDEVKTAFRIAKIQNTFNFLKFVQINGGGLFGRKAFGRKSFGRRSFGQIHSVENQTVKKKKGIWSTAFDQMNKGKANG